MTANLFAEVPGLTKAYMEKIIRRIFARAGVVKMKNDACDRAWASAIHTIVAILIPACNQRVSRHLMDHNYSSMQNVNRMETDSYADKPVLHSHERIRNVPPFPYGGPSSSHSNNNNQSNHEARMIRNVPPRHAAARGSDGNVDSNHHDETWHYVLVLKQLEDASRPILVVDSSVYGDGWHVVDASLTRNKRD
jgi:hypothetical protein